MSMISGIAARAAEVNAPEEGDYIKDGLLYCGKCHTPKQKIIVSRYAGKQIVPGLCECRKERIAREKAEDAAAERKARINYNRMQGIPLDKRGCTFAHDDGLTPKLSELGRRYVENFEKFRTDGKGLLLYGAPSRGKSFIAACIANALIDKGYTAYMTNFARLNNTLQGMFAGKQDYIDGLREYDLIVIDDLGAERDTSTMTETVYNVIDALRGKPIIVTTNLKAEELKAQSDISHERIIKRLFEACIPYEVKGPERRLKAMKDGLAEYRDLLGIDGGSNG